MTPKGYMFKGKTPDWVNKKKPTVKKTATKALRLAKRINSRFEIKAIDNTQGSIATTGGTITYLCPIPKGEGNGQREGLKVYSTSLQWRGTFNLATTNLGSGNGYKVRLIFFIDKRQEAPTGGGTGQSPPSVNGANGLLAEASPESMYNFYNKERFHILSDKVYSLGPTTSVYVDPATNFYAKPSYSKGYVKLGRKIGFQADDANSCNMNGVYMLCIADNTASFQTSSVTTRISYRDN